MNTNNELNELLESTDFMELIGNEAKNIILALQLAKGQKIELRKINLKGANLYRANLYRANLKGANLKGANLTRADLDSTNKEAAKM